MAEVVTREVIPGLWGGGGKGRSKEVEEREEDRRVFTSTQNEEGRTLPNMASKGLGCSVLQVDTL